MKGYESISLPEERKGNKSGYRKKAREQEDSLPKEWRKISQNVEESKQVILTN
jgi:hypothetical protein